MSTEAVRTTCPYCGVGCGLRATADSSQGDPEHPANLGRLCGKGLALHETLGEATRLLHPRVDGARASWDTALDRIAHAFADTIARHGPDSVALYVSGQLLTEDYYACNKFAKGFLGTANIDSNSRLCMASAVAGHIRAFGEDVVPIGYDDLLTADLAVLVGSNAAWCHPVLFRRLVEAGVPRVVIDPRRTATAEGAALHLPIRPGSDVLLFNGLLAALADRGLCRGGADAQAAIACARADAPDAASVAHGCEVPLADVAAFFDRVARTPRTVTLFSQGVNQSSAGTDKVNAIINAHVLTGRIGAGAGPFSITGQPNAMGGREVGALATTLAGHLTFDPADRAAVGAYWSAARLAERPGLKAVDLFEAIGAGRVRAVWIIGTNPVVSVPEAERVRAALAACPFVAVSECAADADTLAFAHVALPALAWGERDGTVTNSERVISRQRPFRAPPGEARADWRAVAGVAGRMGFAEAFAWADSSAIFAEHARLTVLPGARRRHFAIAHLACDRAAYDAMAPVRWPIDLGRLRAEARAVPVRARPPEQAPGGAYRMVLNTGRIRDQWHTMTRTGLVPKLFTHLPEPFVSVHPGDLPGVADGALAQLTTPHGEGYFRVRHDVGMRSGEVFVPMHWTRAFAPAGRSNGMVNAAPDPISGQPELKHTPVAVAAFAADWHAHVVHAAALEADAAPYAARWPAAGGAWRHALAGTGRAEAAILQLHRRCEAGGAWSALRDPAAGRFAAVQAVTGRLLTVLFVSTDSAAVADLGFVVPWFAEGGLPEGGVRAALAGRLVSGASEGSLVCSCLGVGRRAIAAAVAAGATNVAAVGRATGAGTNCGSCQPEIAGVLRELARSDGMLAPAA